MSVMLSKSLIGHKIVFTEDHMSNTTEIPKLLVICRKDWLSVVFVCTVGGKMVT